MAGIPGHTLPSYSNEVRDDTLFHYTTANGLSGIFETGVIWGTAYHCANDESELAAGKGALQQLFRAKTHELEEANDQRVLTLRRRGQDPLEFAAYFEQLVSATALSLLCAYITCFCKPNGKEDFHHGLLSQWRGYGVDGGYALQFSRKKLLAAIENANKIDGLNYELQDVHYSPENRLKDELLSHKEAFVDAYLAHLNEISQLLQQILENKTIPSPIADLTGGPLESLLDYLVQTKNQHFAEERECRLSLIQLVANCEGCLPVKFFNRGGLLVPYTKTPPSFNVLDSVEWILIGPGPRLNARFKSVMHLVAEAGWDIKVRPSHIPFTRL